MNKFTITLLLSSSIILSGCASNSPESDPSYVSPTFYQGYNCKQIKAEKLRLNSKIEQALKVNPSNQVLDTVLSAYAISQGYGVSNQENKELKRFQNQFDVLEQTAIQKECN